MLAGLAWLAGAAPACAVAAAGAASSAIPFRTAEDAAAPGAGQWLLAIGACALVLALLVLLLRHGRGAWLPGRLQARATGRRLRVLERMAAGPQTQLMVVAYGERRLLLAVGPAGTTCLRDDPITDIDAEDAP